MSRKKPKAKRQHIESYEHRDKQRVNNPPVGLVTPNTDPDTGAKKAYTYDPHLDPQLQWAGKAEHTSFEVPNVSLHVHDRIDPRTIVEAVRKRNGNGDGNQLPLFEQEREIPLRQEIEFYQHSHNWTNRLVAGDSLLVMNSLLQKENIGGGGGGGSQGVQCIYMDPPYGIKYGSNFQPFVNKRDVKDGKDEDLTTEPETIKAFRDTWELGIHSYLSYMRDRLLLARELLTESGSVFVQISDENVHHIREIMDEVFGVRNFVAQITYTTQAAKDASSFVGNIYDFLLWYSKDIKSAKRKYRQLFMPKTHGAGINQYNRLENSDGIRRKCSKEEIKNPSIIPESSRLYRLSDICSQGSGKEEEVFRFEGKKYYPRKGTHWTTTIEGLSRLTQHNRIEVSGSFPCFVRFLDDYPVTPLSNMWSKLGGESTKIFVVQTAVKVIERCILMTTDPGDLVFDPTCGSGTTAYVAEQWGRRWITCDTSRVALTLAKQRLMTATFDYYKLAYPDEGVGSGFKYKKVPHVTLKSIANDEPPATETLYDQPLKDNKRARVTGPFTVEAVPSPTVQPISDVLPSPSGRGIKGEGERLSVEVADASLSRSGETLRQSEWRDELLKTGIRGKNGQHISFSRVEPIPCRWLHAEAETKPDDSGSDEFKEAATAYNPHRAVISFGPEHAPLEQRQVELAWEEARTLMPRPSMLIFAAFQFDPEAAKDIDELSPEKTGMTLLKVQMNADMQTDDLKKKRASNESFWLVGQPDVAVCSYEFLVSSDMEIASYDVFKELSGLDSLAKVNQLSQQDLLLYLILSQGREVWHYLASEKGWNLYPSKHSGGTSETKQKGISAISLDSTGFVSRVRDFFDNLSEFGISGRSQLKGIAEQLRRDSKVTLQLEEIAQGLKLPTQNSKLTTKNYSQITIRGFDYFNTKTGKLESGDEKNIAVWMLDTDYDGRCLYPRQVFFPMADSKGGWTRLAKNLKAEIDQELIEAYRGTVSLPFELGKNRRVAVKIVDDRGIESLKVVEV